MKFHVDNLFEVMYNDFGDFRHISNEIIDTSRWSVLYLLTFKHKDKFYQISYSKGATEYQDEQPFEDTTDENGMVDCQEVKPVEKTITVYENV
jgi:hypothetical protein